MKDMFILYRMSFSSVKRLLHLNLFVEKTYSVEPADVL